MEGCIPQIFPVGITGQGEKKVGFELGGRFYIEKNELLQPMQGLTDEAVREALKPFDVSEEFIQTVMERGVVA